MGADRWAPFTPSDTAGGSRSHGRLKVPAGFRPVLGRRTDILRAPAVRQETVYLIGILRWLRSLSSRRRTSDTPTDRPRRPWKEAGPGRAHGHRCRLPLAPPESMTLPAMSVIGRGRSECAQCSLERLLDRLLEQVGDVLRTHSLGCKSGQKKRGAVMIAPSDAQQLGRVGPRKDPLLAFRAHSACHRTRPSSRISMQTPPISARDWNCSSVKNRRSIGQRSVRGEPYTTLFATDIVRSSANTSAMSTSESSHSSPRAAGPHHA